MALPLLGEDAMTTGEREMVRPLGEADADSEHSGERFTSLQPTYEDSVVPKPEDEWNDDDY